MDLTKLSDNDLMALKAGDLTKVSDEGLMHLKGESQSKPSLMQNIGTMVGNVPKSAGNFLSGIAETVLHPIDTATNIADVVAGGVKNAMPTSVSNLIDKYEIDPQSNARAVEKANAVGQFYKDRYGSIENVGKSIVQDPVGVAADASTLLGLGAGLTGGKVSNALSAASKYTNPMSAAAPLFGGVANAGATVGKNALGLATGVGPENISQAFKAGMNNKTLFMDNLTGKVPMTDVLEAAKQNLANMGATKSSEYRSGMLDISKDKSVLNFDGINNALDKAASQVAFKGEVKNAAGNEVLQKIRGEIEHWKSLNPNEYHTPEGMDALKQKIGGLVESLPFEEKTARMVGNNIYHSIKNEITQQAPTYADVMRNYHNSTEQISEIERALSLGDRASKDTAMRKLQSLARNNANTNYGNRLDLAKQLESGGGNEILPSIAGQAMNSLTPRSLTGQAGAMGVAGAAISNPAMLTLLPLQSPKIVGAGLYGAGRAADFGRKAASSVPLNAQEVNMLAQLLSQSGGISQNAQKNVGK